MSTTTFPTQGSSLYNDSPKRLPSNPPRKLALSNILRRKASTVSTSSTSSQEFSLSPTPPIEEYPASKAAMSNSWLETIINVLQTLQTTIWIYIISGEALVRQYVEQYLQKDSQVHMEPEKSPVKDDSVPEIVGASRTGINVREIVIGGSKRGSLDERRKRSSSESGRPWLSIKSSKGTGFEEPFCRFRNTTLPHPSADLSRNATISDPDIAYSKAHHRVRIPGRRSSHNRGVSYGKILPGDAGYSNGGRLWSITNNDSAIGTPLEGHHDDICYEDGSKEMGLTRLRTALTGSTTVGSPIEPIVEVGVPSEKPTKHMETLIAESRRSTNSDWERETSKALESIMSPLSLHPVSINESRSPNTKNFEIPAKSPINTRPSTAPAPTAPIVKPGGFNRLSASGPQHGKKDSGAGLPSFEMSGRDGSRRKSSGELVPMDSVTDNETTPTKTKEKRLLRKLKFQKA